MTKSVLITNQTKKAKAMQLYLNNHTLNRKELIDKFCEELFITENSARTHINQCAKILNQQLNKPYISRNITRNLKRTKAYDLFVQNPSLNRKEMILLLQDKLSMTDNSAATHCSMCAKQFVKDKGLSVQHNAIRQ